MSAIYEWNSGSLRLSGDGVTLNTEVPAEVFGREFERIEKAQGDVKPEVIVQVARKRTNPLHKAFEWDDTVAGERYRLEQAKMMTRALVKNIELPDGKTESVRVAVKTSQRGGYKNIDVAMSDANDRAYVLQQALNQLVAWRRRWASLNQYAELIDAGTTVDKAIKTLQKSVAE